MPLSSPSHPLITAWRRHVSGTPLCGPQWVSEKDKEDVERVREAEMKGKIKGAIKQVGVKEKLQAGMICHRIILCDAITHFCVSSWARHCCSKGSLKMEGGSVCFSPGRLDFAVMVLVLRLNEISARACRRCYNGKPLCSLKRPFGRGSPLNGAQYVHES